MQNFDTSANKETIVKAFRQDSLNYLQNILKGGYELNHSELEQIYELATEYKDKYGKRFCGKNDDLAGKLMKEIFIKNIPNKDVGETAASNKDKIP